MRCEFKVLGRPVGKQRRIGQGGAAFIPKKTQNYMGDVWNAARAQRPAGWPTNAYYQLRWVARYPNHAVSDADNLAKSIKDGCEDDTGACLWTNDLRVRKESCEVLTDPEHPDVQRSGGVIEVVVTTLRKSDCEVQR